MPRIYLGGPINASDDPYTWREQATEIATMETVNPLDENDYSGGEHTPRDVVASDLDLLSACDAVVFRREDGVETWGTPMEVQWAYDRDIPAVCYDPHDSETSVWIRDRSEGVYADLERAVVLAEALVA